MYLPGNDASDGPRKRTILFFAFAAAYGILFVLTSGNPFFLDKDILFSKIAFWLTENHFSPVLPDSIDPGYPPTMGYVLALVWNLFGRNLFISHTVILPFTLGIIWQTYRFVSSLLPRKALVPAMLILMIDSTLLAQSTLFSTDIILLFFFLLAINAVIRNRSAGLTVAVTGLLFTHMRGAFLVAAVFLFEQLRSEYKGGFSARARSVLSYLPGMFLFTTWMLFHQAVKGWTGYAPDSPWKESLEVVEFGGFLRNLLVVAWRLVDHGKVFVWASLAYFAMKLRNLKPENRKDLTDLWLQTRRQKPETRKDFRDLGLLLALVMLVSIPSMLLLRNLNSHRYFMTINFVASATAVYLIYSIHLRAAARKVLLWIIVTGLLSGHFWVYPDRVAKGWDASLAYLPYPSLRSQMIHYIEQHQIPFDQVGTESPNTIVFKYIDLTSDERSFERLSFNKHRYVFWSNVYNMFTDEELDALTSSWTVEKEFRCLQVVVRLYREPDL